MKKFDTILEGAFSRFQGGGFLSGDLVKLRGNALTSEWAKKQPENLMQKLKEFAETDENIRVSSVKALRPAAGGGTQQDNQVDDFYCDVVREKAPGLFIDFITIPSELLEYIDLGVNLPPIPDSQRGSHPGDGKPEEVKQEEVSASLPYDQTGVNSGDKQLPDSNTSLDYSDKPTDNFSTKVYMQ